MVEKRKNSDPRRPLTMVTAIALVLAGLFVGLVMTSDTSLDTITEQASIPDLTGEWIGTTTEDYNDEPRYDYRIVITQTNNEIDGVGYLDMTDGDEIYAEEVISGYIADDQIVYREIKTMRLDNMTMDQWCHTETTLSYQVVNGQETLVGSWEYTLGDDPNCEGISGRVLLTRQ